MHDWSSLSHVRWECKYHVVIVPKYRKKSLYGGMRKQVGEILIHLTAAAAEVGEAGAPAEWRNWRLPMRTNPFYDVWLFLIGATEDHTKSGVGYLMVVLFLALLAASLAIAWRNWQQDPGQRKSEHLAI